MKCSRFCHRNIRPGLEAAKRVEWWRLPDGQTRVLSDTVNAKDGSDGKLASAEPGWRLAEAAHAKCYYADLKRTRRAADAAEHAGNRSSGGNPPEGG